MVAIASLVVSGVFAVWSQVQARRRAEPVAWPFWFFLAIFISSIPMVFFDEVAAAKTGAAVVSSALFLYALSLMARGKSLNRGT